MNRLSIMVLTIVLLCNLPAPCANNQNEAPREHADFSFDTTKKLILGAALFALSIHVYKKYQESPHRYKIEIDNRVENYIKQLTQSVIPSAEEDHRKTLLTALKKEKNPEIWSGVTRGLLQDYLVASNTILGEHAAENRERAKKRVLDLLDIRKQKIADMNTWLLYNTHNKNPTMDEQPQRLMSILVQNKHPIDLIVALFKGVANFHEISIGVDAHFFGVKDCLNSLRGMDDYYNSLYNALESEGLFL